MAKLYLDWSDGRYSTRPLNDEEAAKCEGMGITVAHLEDHIYEAYLRDCGRDAIWQALWRAISNEQYARQREKELMPLEEAGREIARLKEDLARAKRMEQFYEEQYAKNLGERHREEYGEYTCVYPQPGCDVAVLPIQWQDRAQEILEQYRPDRIEGSLKYQGCCCGNAHEKLADVTAAQLRSAGFLVEHDAEAA